MDRQVHCIMLIDDNKIDNFFHERIIKKSNAAPVILTYQSARHALAYLANTAEQPVPQVIFLDINMPGMDGWEFLEEYKKLGAKDTLIVIFTSDYKDPEDEVLEAIEDVFAVLKPKPITKEMLEEVLEKYYIPKS